jgi:hypothetical protein
MRKSYTRNGVLLEPYSSLLLLWPIADLYSYYRQIIRKLPLLGRESLLFDNEIKAFLWLDIGGAFYNIMLDSGAKARRYHARSNA